MRKGAAPKGRGQSALPLVFARKTCRQRKEGEKKGVRITFHGPEEGGEGSGALWGTDERVPKRAKGGAGSLCGTRMSWGWNSALGSFARLWKVTLTPFPHSRHQKLWRVRCDRN